MKFEASSLIEKALEVQENFIRVKTEQLSIFQSLTNMKTKLMEKSRFVEKIHKKILEKRRTVSIESLKDKVPINADKLLNSFLNLSLTDLTNDHMRKTLLRYQRYLEVFKKVISKNADYITNPQIVYHIVLKFDENLSQLKNKVEMIEEYEHRVSEEQERRIEKVLTEYRQACGKDFEIARINESPYNFKLNGCRVRVFQDRDRELRSSFILFSPVA